MSSRHTRLRVLPVTAAFIAALTVGCEGQEPATTIQGETEQPVPGEPGAPEGIGPEGQGDDPATDTDVGADEDGPY